MTALLRHRIAKRFRQLLDAGEHRKAAFLMVKQETGACRRSVYRYCAEFGVSTR